MQILNTNTLINLLDKDTTTTSQLACVISLLGGDYSKGWFAYTSELGEACVLDFDINRKFPYWEIYIQDEIQQVKYIVGKGTLVNDY